MPLKTPFLKNMIRLIMLVSLFPLVGISVLMYETYTGIEIMKEEYVKNLNNIEWMYITRVIDVNKTKAREISDSVKNKIVTDIPSKYPDVNDGRLKSDLADLNNDTPISSIMSNAIKDVYLNVNNNHNTCIVLTDNGFIADRRKPLSFHGKTWNEIKALSPNPELEELFIKNALRGPINDGIVFHQVLNTEDEKQIKNMTMESLKNAYTKYGLNEMKKYNIVVFSYIYDDVDIFGKPHMNTHGILKESDKIVVAQEFNIYDAIASHSAVFLNYIKEYRASHKVDLTSLKMNYVTYGFILSSIFFSLMMLVTICLKQNHVEKRR